MMLFQNVMSICPELPRAAFSSRTDLTSRMFRHHKFMWFLNGCANQCIAMLCLAIVMFGGCTAQCVFEREEMNGPVRHSARKKNNILG